MTLSTGGDPPEIKHGVTVLILKTAVRLMYSWRILKRLMLFVKSPVNHSSLDEMPAVVSFSKRHFFNNCTLDDARLYSAIRVFLHSCSLSPISSFRRWSFIFGLALLRMIMRSHCLLFSVYYVFITWSIKLTAVTLRWTLWSHSSVL